MGSGAQVTEARINPPRTLGGIAVLREQIGVEV